METKVWNWKFMLLFFSCAVVLTGCGTDDEPAPGGEATFRVESADLDIASDDITVRVPYAGKTYELTVKASPEVRWRASVETGDLVAVTPVGEQTGDGTVRIVAAENPEREAGRTAVVAIENGIGKPTLRITFEQKEKELYIPEGSEGQTREQFDNPNSNFSVYRMKQSDNIAVFWEKSFGMNPEVASERPFKPEDVLLAGEEVYSFLIDELGFADRTVSCTNKYKMLFFVFNDDGGTAWGGGDHQVGKVWLRPGMLQNPRFGILYHEMCHCFQYMARWDGAASLSGPINEMTSQWALLRRFPNWADLEPGHFTAFMNLTHLAFGHEENGYHSPYVLEYWAGKHGKDIVSRIWKEAADTDNSDPVAVYKRITRIDQEQFNDEMYDAAARFMTWDIPLIRSTYAKYVDKHTCSLKRTGAKTFRIVPERCPQNYGYNGIKLRVPAAGTKLALTFTGVMGVGGFHYENSESRGWRYGFVALKTDNERIYGEMGKTTEGTGTLEFVVPENTKYLWLVVTGAPAKHWKHTVDNRPETDEQWPYEFTLIGTDPDTGMCSVTND